MSRRERIERAIRINKTGEYMDLIEDELRLLWAKDDAGEAVDWQCTCEHEGQDTSWQCGFCDAIQAYEAGNE